MNLPLLVVEHVVTAVHPTLWLDVACVCKTWQTVVQESFRDRKKSSKRMRADLRFLWFRRNKVNSQTLGQLIRKGYLFSLDHKCKNGYAIKTKPTLYPYILRTCTSAPLGLYASTLTLLCGYFPFSMNQWLESDVLGRSCRDGASFNFVLWLLGQMSQEDPTYFLEQWKSHSNRVINVLNQACIGSSKEVVQFLLQKFSVSCRYISPSHAQFLLRQTVRGNNTVLLEWLHQEMGNPEFSVECVADACQSDSQATLDWLHRKQSNIKFSDPSFSFSSNVDHYLELAIHANSFSVINWFRKTFCLTKDYILMFSAKIPFRNMHGHGEMSEPMFKWLFSRASNNSRVKFLLRTFDISAEDLQRQPWIRAKHASLVSGGFAKEARFLDKIAKLHKAPIPISHLPPAQSHVD
jgi:hypothetical protein